MATVFRDVDTEPTDAAIRDALGPSVDAWDGAVAMFAEAGAPVSWRYYRDGGWLAKAAAGKKTISWVAVDDGCLRVTFYFAERHRAVLRDAADLTAEVRDRIDTTPLTGKLLPVTFVVRDRADLAQVGAVLAVKLTAK